MATLPVTMKKQSPMVDPNGSVTSLRALAASTGVQFSDLQAELFRLREKLGPDQKKGYDESIRQMVRGGALSQAEQRVLLQLGAKGFAVSSDGEFAKFLRYAQALHQRMSRDSKAGPVALAITGVIANYVVSPAKFDRRSRALARASKHPVRDILLGVAGGAFGGLRMSGWNPIGGVVGGVVGGAIAAVKALC